MATNWEELVSNEELQEAAKERKATVIEEKVIAEKIKSYENNGWEIVKVYANGSAKMKKSKNIGDLFENEVWNIFYKMGFKVMNAKNDFKLDYAGGPSTSKQIDVVAIDEEVCLLIECKSTEKQDNLTSWKTDLEAINGNFGGFCKEIKKKYPGRKIKYIFATKNYVIGQADISRMQSFKIANFDYEIVTYYNELVNHLGSAARYQLLGNLFAKTPIKGMEETVPAIEGKMGGLTYYTFLIEPERLLKLAYILHRNKANHSMMPTYQRIVKKDRLKAIREFVDKGGYFPNSLIVSIDTENKGIRFDKITSKTENNLSRIGHLYLPKTYQSLYVIDGQHRLYGYSDSKYADNNSIPVVAFIDMKKEDQVKMFMDINENQKSVSKSLRNTLNIDLLWKSELYAQRQEALMLDIGQSLGEDFKSPLYGRVVTGENTSNGKRCITLEYIKDALKQSDFFNAYKKNKNEIVKHGTFDKIENDETKILFYPFLVKCTKLISDYCSEEWEKGNNGFMSINNMIYAIIKVINDVVNMTLQKEGKTIVDNAQELYAKAEELLFCVADTIKELNPDVAKEIKTAKGGAAKKVAWRKLQVEIHNKHSQFTNDDLEEYIKENCVNNNPMAADYITRIKEKLIEMFKEKLSCDKNWMYKYLPDKLREELITKFSVENSKREFSGNQERVDEWDYISFKEIRQIATHKSNWSDFCQSILTKPDNKTNKLDAVKWLIELESAHNRISNGQAIVTSEFNNIERIFKIFCEEEVLV